MVQPFQICLVLDLPALIVLRALAHLVQEFLKRFWFNYVPFSQFSSITSFFVFLKLLISLAISIVAPFLVL